MLRSLIPDLKAWHFHFEPLFLNEAIREQKLLNTENHSTVMRLIR